MTIKFNNPTIQTVAEAVVAKHGGNVNLLTIKSAGIALTGTLHPQYEVMMEQQCIDLCKQAEAIKDCLAVCRLAKQLGAEVIEVP